MRIAHILVLIALSQATTFLRDTYTLIYDQPTSLFSEEELAKNTEIKQTKDDNINYLDEQLSSLANAEESQTLLAYESDLPASGDCIILYSQCNFKGLSRKVCKDPSEAMSFQSPVYSIYVPDGQQFSTLDSNSQSEVTFLTSDDCLDQPIVMVGQLDFLIAQSSQYWIGESVTTGNKYMYAETSLIQQDQSVTENQTEAPQTEATEQSEQAPESQQKQPTEAEVTSQPQEAQDQVAEQPEVQTEQPQPEAEQPQPEAEQPQPEAEQPQPEAEQPQPEAEQPQSEAQPEAQPEAEQPQQQPETESEVKEDDKLVEEVLDKVEDVVEQVTDLQQAELEASKEEIKEVEQPVQTEASIDDIPQIEVQEPEQSSQTAEPLVGQTQLQK